MTDGAKYSLLAVTTVAGFLFGALVMTVSAVAFAQVSELVFTVDERFATSTMSIAQQEQIIWLEQRIKVLEQNDMQIIYLLEKSLGL